MNAEDRQVDENTPHPPPSRETLSDRIWRHQEELRLGRTSRRRVGAALPTSAEVEAVLSARRAAEAARAEARLRDDVHRTGVAALRCYDTSHDAHGAAGAPLGPAVPMSDVQVRQDVVRPLMKLIAIVALRQRFAHVLRSATAAGASKAAEPEEALAASPRSHHLPLPATPAIPCLTTLLRQLPLPDLAVQGDGGARAVTDAGAAGTLLDVPRCPPLHEPFVFRLRHFAPIGVPPFALEVESQAERELVSGAAADPRGGDLAAVPTMSMQLSTRAPHAVSAADTESWGGASATVAATLARIASDAHGGRTARAAASAAISTADTDTFAPVMPSKARIGFAASIVQPQPF